MTTARDGVLSPPTGRDLVAEYATRAPLALALERAMECQLYIGRTFDTPVLDVGCGDGCFVEVLFGSGAAIDYGLDPDGQELARAKRRGVYRGLLEARADRIPLADGSVGTVMSNSTLEHIPGIEPVLREILRVLRPGGVLYITVPTDKFDRYPWAYLLLRGLRLAAAAERFRVAYNAFWKHYNFYPPAEWHRLLERIGFRVVEVTEYGSPVKCLVDDMLVPVAFPAHLVKKKTDRYFVFPALRRALIRLLRPVLPRDRRPTAARGTGGLVFLAAAKPAETST